VRLDQNIIKSDINSISSRKGGIDTAALHNSRYMPHSNWNVSASPPSHLLNDPRLEEKIQEIIRERKQQSLKISLNKCQDGSSRPPTPMRSQGEDELREILRDLE
jgi:hypothetical protein